MALKQVNTEFVQLKNGDKVNGYLLGVGVQEFTNQGKTSPVPTAILQRKDGSRFKVILGAAVLEDAQLLAKDVWTQIEKVKEQRKTRSGNNINEFRLLQDADDVRP